MGDGPQCRRYCPPVRTNDLLERVSELGSPKGLLMRCDGAGEAESCSWREKPG